MDRLIIDWAERIRAARDAGTPLAIVGGGSKSFYGEPSRGTEFRTGELRGIISYEPTELVLTARAGTPLAEIESTLRERGQMLAFEPPHFGAATLGGVLATGLSGPRRASAGSARDFVLGVRLLDGNGSDLRFGGQVMKNVAGYDVSRLTVGAMGTLGVLLEASLKVLPLPPAERTLRLVIDRAGAIARMNRWAGRPLPISATCHDGETLTLRLSGADSALRAAGAEIGGEALDDAQTWWHDLREQRHAFFAGDTPLWRLSVKSTAAELPLAGPQLIEWGGALRWLRTDATAAQVRAAAAAAGGHATLFRRLGQGTAVFHPPSPALLRLHRELKRTFDPAGILNRGRLYPEL